MIEQLRLAASLNLPEQVIRFKISPWRNKAASIAQMNIKSISVINNPDNKKEASFQELDYLIASGWALPGKPTDIEAVPKHSENHIINCEGKGDLAHPFIAVDVKNNIVNQSENTENHIINSGKGNLAYSIYAADIKNNAADVVNNISKHKDTDGVDSVFDPTKIATKMLVYHKRAKMRASKGNT